MTHARLGYLFALGAALGACGGKAPAAATPAEATPTTPAPAAIAHGQEYWAVYFAMAPVGTASLDGGAARARQMGFQGFPKDPGCDVPVGEPPPGLNDPVANLQVVAEYFDREADARAVAAAAGAPAPWVGRVKTMCLD